MIRSLLSALLLCAIPAMAQAPKPVPARVEVSVRRIEQDAMRMYDISASGSVRAAPAAVWKVLTAYDKMHEFVPDLSACRVLSRNGNEAIVEQFGTAHFLFMSKSIHLVVRATETAMSSIDIALISGDLKHYESRWELTPIADTGGTRINYSGKLAPNFYVPGVLGATVIRGDIERMMLAVLAHLDAAYE